MRVIDTNALKQVLQYLKRIINNKQDKLIFDDTPNESSNNPVTSNGVKTYIDKTLGNAIETEIKARSDADSALRNDINSIPSWAKQETKPNYTANEVGAVSQEEIKNYYTKSDVDEQISTIPKFAIEVVDVLPTSDISDSIVYLLKTSESETGNLYTEYIYTNDTWEQLGTQKLDLTDYYQKSDIDTLLSSTDQTVQQAKTDAQSAKSVAENAKSIADTIQAKAESGEFKGEDGFSPVPQLPKQETLPLFPSQINLVLLPQR